MESNYNKMKKASEQNQEMILMNKANYKKRSTNRLLKIIQKKITTTMIGAISQIESNFGHLWGHGKMLRELSQSEQQYREIWNSVRNNILTNGNNQCRNIEKEINEYSIEWNRHHLMLLMKEENGE